MNSQASATMKKELQINSAPENITLVEKFVEELKDALDFKDDSYANIMVAVTEAVNNSIIHGNKADSKKNVMIGAESLSQYRLKFTIEDEGEGFDHSNLSDPTAPENLENPGGRGVFLMEHLSDEISFGNEGRRVEMIFNI